MWPIWKAWESVSLDTVVPSCFFKRVVTEKLPPFNSVCQRSACSGSAGVGGGQGRCFGCTPQARLANAVRLQRQKSGTHCWLNLWKPFVLHLINPQKKRKSQLYKCRWQDDRNKDWLLSQIVFAVIKVYVCYTIVPQRQWPDDRSLFLQKGTLDNMRVPTRWCHPLEESQTHRQDLTENSQWTSDLSDNKRDKRRSNAVIHCGPPCHSVIPKESWGLGQISHMSPLE